MKRIFLCYAWILAILLTSGPVFAQITKTVGSGGADYTTLKDAFDAINSGTHTGSITLQLVAGTTETATAQLNASGSGSASYTALTIYPTVTGIVITGTLAAPLLDFNGADNVVIDGRVNATGSGKDLLITNLSTSAVNGTSTLRFINDASSNTVRYCLLKGSERSDNSGIIFFSTSGGLQGNDDNTITNNDLTCSSDGTRPKHVVYAVGTAGNDNSGNTVSNNNFYNFLSRVEGSDAVDLLSGNTDYTISGNSFYETATFIPSVNTGYSIITINNSSGNNFTVAGNYLGGSAPLCGGTAWTKLASTRSGFVCLSMNVGEITASNVQGNTIQNISNANSSNTRDFTAITVSGSVNIGTTTGNTIGQATGNGSITLSNVPTCILIAAGGNGTINIRNNTIGSITSASSIYAINTGTSGTITIADNVIGSSTTSNSIYASGGAQNVYGIMTNSNGAATISGNTIRGLSNNTTGGGTVCTGLYYGGSTTASTVFNNFIHTIVLTNAGATSASLYGLQIASGTAIYYNNIISVGNNTPASVYGISDNGGTNQLYFNTVYIGGAPATGGNASYALFSNGSNTRNYSSNILFNARSNNGATGNNYAISLATAPVLVDYNDYYAPGTNGVLGSFNAVDKTTLTEFKSSTLQDCNGYNADPSFALEGGTVSTDYLPSAPFLMASAINGISNDIGNLTRSTSKPAMGAWEYAITPGANSLHISSFLPATGSSGNPVTLTGTNFGTATAVSFNGTAATFTINSATEITAIVPAAAGTGKLSLSSACGAVLSANDFIELTTLPLNWLSFTAIPSGSGALLQWSTGNEQNTANFEAEHSTNGFSWQTIGTIAAMRKLPHATYRFTHSTPVPGNNYYRIRQKDLDGSSSYSKVVQHAWPLTNQNFRILNNPVVSGLLQLQLSVAAEISIYNGKGQLLLRRPGTAGIVAISTTSFPKGLYLLSVGREVRKFLVN